MGADLVKAFAKFVNGYLAEDLVKEVAKFINGYMVEDLEKVFLNLQNINTMLRNPKRESSEM